VEVPGVGRFIAEPPDSDDTFPPAIASYRDIGGWLFYTGHDGSQGVIAGSRDTLEQWKEHVDRLPKRSTPQSEAWDEFRHDGGERIAGARRAGKAVADAFGLSNEVEFLVQGVEPTSGEHLSDRARVVNAHTDAVQEYTGAFSGLKMQQGAHTAAHEMAHQAFSKDPEAGHAVMRAVREHTIRHGALTMYHAISGSSHEGLMEAAALYVLAPREMAQRAPALYAALHHWFASARERFAKPLQTGVRGGRYYMTPSGTKVYIRRKGGA
jgi:hypothetical protein